MSAPADSSFAAVRPWPVVPPPQPGESLSSWLARIGQEYGLAGDQLLGSDGPAAMGTDVTLDEDPPDDLVAWLSRKTGQAPRRIRAMTLSGFVPFLLDGVAPPAACLATYVAGTRLITGPDERIVKTKTLPWIDRTWTEQWACSACLEADDAPYRRLSWYLPWMLTCPLHGAFLNRVLVQPGRTWDVMEERPFGRAPPEEDLLRLDRATHQAVTRGIVETATGRIAGGIWVRLLRAVIEELAHVVPDGSPRGMGIAEVWADVGVAPPTARERACSYEALPPRFKLRRMRAAALALERARSVLTDWMDGNALPWLDPEADAVRRSLTARGAGARWPA